MFLGPFSLLSLCFLDLWVCVFFYIWEVFSHYFIISFQPHSPSETLMLQMLDLLLLFHTSLWLCWLFFSVCFLNWCVSALSILMILAFYMWIRKLYHSLAIMFFPHWFEMPSWSHTKLYVCVSFWSVHFIFLFLCQDCTV